MTTKREVIESIDHLRWLYTCEQLPIAEVVKVLKLMDAVQTVLDAFAEIEGEEAQNAFLDESFDVEEKVILNISELTALNVRISPEHLHRILWCVELIYIIM
jgi:hypothetical protein